MNPVAASLPSMPCSITFSRKLLMRAPIRVPAPLQAWEQSIATPPAPPVLCPVRVCISHSLPFPSPSFYLSSSPYVPSTPVPSSARGVHTSPSGEYSVLHCPVFAQVVPVVLPMTTVVTATAIVTTATWAQCMLTVRCRVPRYVGCQAPAI